MTQNEDAVADPSWRPWKAGREGSGEARRMFTPGVLDPPRCPLSSRRFRGGRLIVVR